MAAGSAIVARSLSKRFRLGQGARYGRLSESVWEGLRRPFRRAGGAGSGDPYLWALKEVSFDVAEGEVLGVIGRNGSGKTTLLKVLSRIIEPTSGEADIDGRVGSLLEVGTGFHPELTGRENIFLAGAVLGMGRAEVVRKFDDIVAFAETGPFLETPVKRYSSGMYVRLAFAVAAHLEPEILLVDEVLAVGDAAFQKRCLGKIDDVARGGRTVLFVSHNMAAVEHLCTRAILLRSGRLERSGAPSDVVGHYLSDAGIFSPVVRFDEQTERQGSGEALIDEVRLRGDDSGGDLRVRTGGPFEVSIAFRCNDYQGPVAAGVLVRDRFERFLCDIRSTHGAAWFDVGAGGGYVIQARVPSLALYPGEYTLGVWLAKPPTEDLDYIPDACHLVVEDDGALLADGRLDPKWGQFYVPSEWEIRGA